MIHILSTAQSCFSQRIRAGKPPKSWKKVAYSPFYTEIILDDGGFTYVAPQAIQPNAPMQYMGEVATLPEDYTCLPVAFNLAPGVSYADYLKSVELIKIGSKRSGVFAIRNTPELIPIAKANSEKGYQYYKECGSVEDSNIFAAVINAGGKIYASQPTMWNITLCLHAKDLRNFPEELEKIGYRVYGDTVVRVREVPKIVRVPTYEEYYIGKDENVEFRLKRLRETLDIDFDNVITLHEAPDGSKAVEITNMWGYSQQVGIRDEELAYNINIPYTYMRLDKIPSTLATVDIYGNISFGVHNIPRIEHFKKSWHGKGYYYYIGRGVPQGYKLWTPYLAKKYNKPNLIELFTLDGKIGGIFPEDTELEAKSYKYPGLKYYPAGHTYSWEEQKEYNDYMLYVERGEWVRIKPKSIKEPWARFEELGWALWLLKGYTEKQLPHASTLENLIKKHMPETAFHVQCNTLFIKKGYETLTGCLEHMCEFKKDAQVLLASIGRLALSLNKASVQNSLISIL